MTAFQTEIRDRVAAAQESLAAARQNDDDYLVGIHTGELESLSRLASDHELEVPGLSLVHDEPADDSLSLVQDESS